MCDCVCVLKNVGSWLSPPQEVGENQSWGAQVQPSQSFSPKISFLITSIILPLRVVCPPACNVELF